MKELNNFRQFLNESKKKTIKEADFGNDPQDRYDYIRSLMSRLPDTARTEYLIDALDQVLADFNMTDDMKEKTEFDMIFIEIMKELGLESELMEAGDPLINPEAEEIDAEDLEASADYFDSLTENDNVLDEIIKEGTWSLGGPEDIDSIVSGLQALIKMADDTQNKKNAAGRGFVNALQNQLKDEGWNNRLYKIVGDDSFFDYYDAANSAAAIRDFDRVKNHLGDAIARAEELKDAIMKNRGLEEGKFKAGDMARLKNDDGTGPEFAVISTRKMIGKNLEAVRVTDKNGKTAEYDETQLTKTFSPEEKANVFVRENKVLDASNSLEGAINSAADELTDEQIDTITDMILDLRDKVKAQLKKKK